MVGGNSGEVAQACVGQSARAIPGANETQHETIWGAEPDCDIARLRVEIGEVEHGQGQRVQHEGCRCLANQQHVEGTPAAVSDGHQKPVHKIGTMGTCNMLTKHQRWSQERYRRARPGSAGSTRRLPLPCKPTSREWKNLVPLTTPALANTKRATQEPLQCACALG